MILEILLPIPLNKTFFYKVDSRDAIYIKAGKLVEVSFRGKTMIGLIVCIHQTVSFKKKILTIEKVFDNLCLSEEILKSIDFISRYSCIPNSLVFKLFLSGFNSNNKINEETKNELNINNLNFSKEQSEALKKLSTVNLKKHSVFTLQGITGSGKTRVYMMSVYKNLIAKNQSLILVPEIILTKEWVNEIKQDFGISPFIYHSSIKISERKKIWRLAIDGKPLVIVGTRSAIFLPFSNLRLIIVDEEHDTSYKQEEKIIINTRDFAIVRAKYSNCPVILSSATPSVETIFNCKKDKYKKVSINHRVNKIPLPKINIIDKRKENLLISKTLEETIKKNLSERKQTLLFINKRGFAPFAICKKCGHSKSCPNCSTSLAIHDYSSERKYLLCHHCNYKEDFLDKCFLCKKEECFIFPGFGIEKIFDEVKKKFPKSEALFVSSDSIKKSKKIENILKDIIENKIDIICGTQLISKGHNFPNLKTVGILNIDCSLNNFDFRSFEKTFQQILQVSGRAGRKTGDGNVFIETYQPNHPVLKNCESYGYADYYDWELEIRKKNQHPPFTNFISIIVSSKTQNDASSFCEKFSTKIRKQFKNISVYGPSPSLILKKNLFYRYRILLKLNKGSFHHKLKEFLKNQEAPQNTRLYIDVDPINFL